MKQLEKLTLYETRNNSLKLPSRINAILITNCKMVFKSYIGNTGKVLELLEMQSRIYKVDTRVCLGIYFWSDVICQDLMSNHLPVWKRLTCRITTWKRPQHGLLV